MTLISVCGSFAHPDLTPAAGYVMFTPRPSHIWVSGGPIELGTIEAVLDGTGHFTVDLQASDDPDINPTGWTYEIREEIGGGVHRTYEIEIPIATVGCLDFNAAAPVEGAAGSVQLTPGPPGPTGPAGPPGPGGVATYTVGTKPTVVYGQPSLVVGAWTQLWPDDDNRTFASVLGGTGTPGEIIYLTANPLAAVTDPDVAQSNGTRGPLYFETRGTNALYGRLAAGGPLVVRTSQSTPLARSPLPSGIIGVPDYKIVAACGGGAVTYSAGRIANVLNADELRTRATLMGDNSQILEVISTANTQDALFQTFAPLWTSSGPFFPGPLSVEGVDELRSWAIPGQGQTHIFWVADTMVVLP